MECLPGYRKSHAGPILSSSWMDRLTACGPHRFRRGLEPHPLKKPPPAPGWPRTPLRPRTWNKNEESARRASEMAALQMDHQADGPCPRAPRSREGLLPHRQARTVLRGGCSAGAGQGGTRLPRQGSAERPGHSKQPRLALALLERAPCMSRGGGGLAGSSEGHDLHAHWGPKTHPPPLEQGGRSLLPGTPKTSSRPA